MLIAKELLFFCIFIPLNITIEHTIQCLCVAVYNYSTKLHISRFSVIVQMLSKNVHNVVDQIPSTCNFLRPVIELQCTSRHGLTITFGTKTHVILDVQNRRGSGKTRPKKCKSIGWPLSRSHSAG